jgi:hypothetical protein
MLLFFKAEKVDFLKDHWPYNVDDLGELAIKKQTDSF